MALHPITTRPPSAGDSIRRAIKTLPLTEQLEIIQHVTQGAAFADLSDDDLRPLDAALESMLFQSRRDDEAESVRLHGFEVAA